MKHILKTLTILLFVLFSINSFAYDPPNAPPNGTYVLDLANKLTQEQLSQLNNKIENLNRSTKNEYGVLLLASMDGNSIDDVAYSTFNKWGIGKRGLDNGVLLVISFAERKTRIETGKGVEGDLPDLATSDILKNTLKPQLKYGHVYEGINDTIDKCFSVIESRAKEKTNNIGSDSSTDYTILYMVIGIIGGGFLLVFILSIFAKRREEKEAKLYRESRESEKRTYAAVVKTIPDLPHHNIIKTAAIVGTGVAAAVVISEEERIARRKRESEENRRRSDEESNRRASESSSSSSYDSGSSSSYDSGSSSGFDGGGSGGGGSAGDF